MRELFLHRNLKISKFFKALAKSVITEVWRRRLTGEEFGGVGMSPMGSQGSEERQTERVLLGTWTLELDQSSLEALFVFLIPHVILGDTKAF